MVELNRDKFLNPYISFLQKRQDNEVLISSISRAFADHNRVFAKDILPEMPFKGKLPFEVTSALQQKAAELVHPWIKEVLDITMKNPEIPQIHWHSMDQFSGGVHTIKDQFQNGERPALDLITGFNGRLSQYLEVLPKELKIYLKDQNLDDVKTFECFPKKFIPSILSALSEITLANYQGDAKYAKTQADKPYSLYGDDPQNPPAPTVIGACTIVQQLQAERMKVTPGGVITIDINKYLLENPRCGREELLNKIIDTMSQIIQLLSN